MILNFYLKFAPLVMHRLFLVSNGLRMSQRCPLSNWANLRPWGESAHWWHSVLYRNHREISHLATWIPFFCLAPKYNFQAAFCGFGVSMGFWLFHVLQPQTPNTSASSFGKNSSWCGWCHRAVLSTLLAILCYVTVLWMCLCTTWFRSSVWRHFCCGNRMGS